MLVMLVRNNGHLMEKDELIRSLWPDAFVEEGNLSNNVFVLRKALGNDHEYIETVPRRGYRFVGAVRQLPSAEKPLHEPSEFACRALRLRIGGQPARLQSSFLRPSAARSAELCLPRRPRSCYLRLELPSGGGVTPHACPTARNELSSPSSPIPSSSQPFLRMGTWWHSSTVMVRSSIPVRFTSRFSPMANRSN